jgi:two-component system sensor histidine kinase CiaH
MFQSATLKLTLWYAAIIIMISLLFSVLIYSIASSEVGSRIGYLQKNSRIAPTYIINQPYYNNLRDTQVHEAEVSLLVSLVITNAFIWLAGGIGSYYLARRTLRPIEEAHDAQSRFTSDASHELRTPLASMKIELEVALRDGQLKKDEMRELLQSNLEEVNKLTTLSHTLLQLSRLDHDNIVRENVSLNDVAASVIERFNKVQPRIELADSRLLNVRANISNVEELLTILIDNALKYSPDDSKVHIAFMTQKNMSGFTVTNSGEGIAADILPHIFDRFYQADTARTGSEKRGFGLGLSLAKKIVQLHGGELTVSSAPQQDTTFRILLPNFSGSPVRNQ